MRFGLMTAAVLIAGQAAAEGHGVSCDEVQEAALAVALEMRDLHEGEVAFAATIGITAAAKPSETGLASMATLAEEKEAAESAAMMAILGHLEALTAGCD